MIAHFHDAGLKQPTMLCEIPVGGGPDSPIYAWMALTLRSLLPQVEKIGAATAAEIDIDTLEDRLRNAVTAVHGEALCPLQFCGVDKALKYICRSSGCRTACFGVRRIPRSLHNSGRAITSNE